MSPRKHIPQFRNRLAGFASHQRGSMSVLTVAVMVPFMIAAGAAIDMGRANRTLSHMQKSVDSAALAAAATHQPVYVAGTELDGEDARIHAAEMMVDANLIDPIATMAEDPQVTINDDVVVVDLSAEMPTSLMKLVGIDSVSLSVSAAADYSTKGHACILALGPNGNGIKVGGTVVLEVNDCWLHSNKTGAKSIDIIGKATIKAGGSCSAGFTSVSNNATVYRRRLEECAHVDDPMADWPHPDEPLACTENGFDHKGTGTLNLSAGVYCGGLKISGYDYVSFGEGVYHIVDGPLSINSKSGVTGENVGFYLTGDVPSISLNGSGVVTLSADDEGPMKGKLIAMEPPPLGTEPATADLISARINGGTELNLTGTIYLPTADLDISGNSTSLSMATQLIAYSVEMTGTSHLSFQEQLDEFGNPVGPEVARIVKLVQ